MEVKVLLTTLTLTEISARDPPARLLALACRPRVKLLSAPTACTSVLNVSKSTDASLNAGKSTKLQRTANLNSAEIRLCNLQGEAEQVILDPLMESHGSLFGQALIQRKFKILPARIIGECISPNATPDNGYGMELVRFRVSLPPGAAASTSGGIYSSMYSKEGTCVYCSFKIT